MKIPTAPNPNTPYYQPHGMEMNPQWQGNGVVIEGGAPGNGAYILPHHVLPAGYGQPPQYYGPGTSPPAPQAVAAAQDFSEYMWMENEEEFDKQVMQQLEEEALMEQCFEAMMADELEEHNRGEISLEEQVSQSKLNPLAAEFVPTFGTSSAVPSTSERDIQPTQSTPSSNYTKSIESSLSELSISQTSDATTEASKSPTAEQIEPILCSLPLDATPEKPSIQPIEEVIENSTVVVVSANPIVVESKKPSDEDLSKKSSETQKKQSPKENKTTAKSETATAVKTETKPVKSESQPKKTQENIPPKQQNQTSKGGMPKGRTTSESKKEPEAKPPTPVVEVPAVVEIAPSVSPITVVEPEKVVPVQTPTAPAAPVVFNYAAAARANLPPKPSAAPVAQPAASTTPPPAVQPAKQDSAPKEAPPPAAAPTAAAPPTNAAKPQQPKAPAPKQNKAKETKEPAAGKPGTGAARSYKKNNKK